MGIFDSIFGGGGNVSTPKPEDYMPLVQQSADVNRLNQFTPFGTTQYVDKDGPKPLSFDEWSAGNPASDPVWGAIGDVNSEAPEYGWIGSPNTQRADYESYLGSFNDNQPGAQPDVVQEFTPEIQSIFESQFDPNAYQNYADDYMSEATRLLNPIWDRQEENFEQSMFNRGAPVGGELYDDAYSNLTKSRDDAYNSAAFQATQLSDQKRMQDFNKLMAALGGSQVNYQPIDTMGAANMAMNADMTNAQNQAAQSSSFWNTIPQLGLMAYGGANGWWN